MIVYFVELLPCRAFFYNVIVSITEKLKVAATPRVALTLVKIVTIKLNYGAKLSESAVDCGPQLETRFSAYECSI